MDTQVIPVVERYVIDQLRARTSFTALDISNALKADHYLVMHSSVAEVIRDIYRSGAMSFYDFDRRLIDVMAQGGTQKTCAFLYLHNEARERDYTARAQNSLPSVSPDQATPFPIMASPIVPFLKSTRSKNPSVPRGKARERQDGAFAVPRQILAQLGWQAGDALALDAQPGQIVLRITQNTKPDARVWQSQRLRICRRKLCIARLTSESVCLAVYGGSIILKSKMEKGPGSCLALRNDLS